MEFLPNKLAHIEINYCITRTVVLSIVCPVVPCKEERGYSFSWDQALHMEQM